MRTVRKLLLLSLALGLFALLAAIYFQTPKNGRSPDSLLPGPQLREALAKLPLTRRSGVIQAARVKPTTESTPTGPKVPASPGLQAHSEVVLQLHPGLRAEDLHALLSEHALTPVQTLPELGLVVAEVTASALSRAPADIPAQDLARTPLTPYILRLQSDRRVLSAVPNSVLSTFDLSEAVSGPGRESRLGENWGLNDAGIRSAWPALKASYRVGVVDVGFVEHPDVDLVRGLDTPTAASSHGTDVAAILCAKHNASGLSGVLPNCTVIYASTQGILSDSNAPEGTGTVAWSALFSEYLASILDFIRANPTVTSINLSLGYNWLTVLGVDPSTSADVRNLVKSQGRVAMALLEFASERDIAIVSAAGNDSSTLAKPLDARWSSPINFAARLMLGRNRWSNVLIVEAHDRDGRRASFSNAGGDISCPGVEVPRAVVAADGSRSRSGTSFAAPYCTGALVAIRSTVPKLKLEGALECIRRSDRMRDGVPLLNLSFALVNCKASAEDTALRSQAAAIERWTAYLDRDASTPTFATSNSAACQSVLGRAFPVAPTADQGDGRGPEITDPAIRDMVRQYVANLNRSGCRSPVLVARRMVFGPAGAELVSFSLALVNEIYRGGYPGGVAVVEWPVFPNRQDQIRLTANQVVVTLASEDLPRRIADGR